MDERPISFLQVMHAFYYWARSWQLAILKELLVEHLPHTVHGCFFEVGPYSMF